MLNDIYLMNKKTGEIVPYKQVYKEWCKTEHSYLESIFDEWIETDLIVENSYIEFPDFTKAINF
jgi:hypothetical protein